jgi:predicted nucleic acid-binding protein
MQVLIDTGPLVAIVSPDDQYHSLCVKTLASLQTCEHDSRMRCSYI